ncbi:erythromycin esterase family protein [Actinomadura sp. 7K507]|uniref:erythromycin esterase family protein n=1 Tax=Actinomadura sp. 7K507 TaxID=2530365 RepID=UPI001049A0DA|nr:erythromycin esterase family protein [Actinomadura sp. 7K507]TDC84899.1 erythromycin esterase family protein [Actinomadura sp. 7K507]
MTVRNDEVAAAARRWIGENAHALAATDPAEALTDLEPLAAMASGAAVVGIGESTRAGHEVTALGHRVLRLLAEKLGFRVLAIQDDETVVDRLDAYVRTGEGDPREALADLWVPWRSREMLGVVEWARSFNRRHPSDPFRMVGLNPPEARPAHYGAVLGHVAAVGGHRLDELRRHYDTIVTAHQVPEHVQKARGTHPGRPFADHARDARDLVASLPHADAALEAAQLIVDFHSGGFAAGGFDYAATRRRSVAAMTALLEDGATKIAYWEGMSFTANAARLEPAALLEPFQSVGNELRRRLGTGYLSLLIGFGHGDVSGLHPGQRVPPPMAGSADAELAAAGPDLYALDMHAPRPGAVDEWLRGPRGLRIIGGIYDAAADSDHYLAAGRLDEWFDALLHVRAITPTTLL